MVIQVEMEENSVLMLEVTRVDCKHNASLVMAEDTQGKQWGIILTNNKTDYVLEQLSANKFVKVKGVVTSPNEYQKGEKENDYQSA